jgi:hypothetical protein
MWNYEARVAMGFFSGSNNGDRQHHNGNVRDESNPGGAKHAADRTVQPNVDAVRALRPSDYEGRHRSN